MKQMKKWWRKKPARPARAPQRAVERSGTVVPIAVIRRVETVTNQAVTLSDWARAKGAKE